jgi:hypothetical protein
MQKKLSTSICCCLITRMQAKNHDLKIANRCNENVGTTVTNQNMIQEEIKRRLNSGSAYYRLVQSLLYTRLLSKTVKVRT